MSEHSRKHRLANSVLIFGEGCALMILAPMEYATGLYIGIHPAIAWGTTGLVYAVAIAAIAVGAWMPAALGLIWVSGVVGGLHSAAEQAERDHAAAVKRALMEGAPAPDQVASLDRVRAGTCVAVVTIVVAAMALLWVLARRWHTKQAAAAEAAEAAERQRLMAERQAQTDREERARQHQLRMRQAAQEEVERQAQRRAEEAALREQEKVADHARKLDLLRAQAETQITKSQPRPERAERPPRAQKPQVTRPQTAKSQPAEATQKPALGEADLRRRTGAKEAAMEALRKGQSIDSRTHAAAYFGTAEPTEKQLAAARANLSTWRRKVEQESAATDDAEAEEAAQ